MGCSLAGWGRGHVVAAPAGAAAANNSFVQLFSLSRSESSSLLKLRLKAAQST